jgi:rhodanese-related sulfurtransferase
VTTTITPQEAQARIAAGAVLVDIRNPDEYARAHIPCARNIPLSQISRIEDAPAVIFHCKSGMRTGANAAALSACTDAPTFLLEGGFDAWQKAGLECRIDAKQPIEVMRQVQIAAGSLVLIGVILGFAVSPIGFGLSAFVGAGLVFAGTTGWCGMAKLLGQMPWNRTAKAA